MAESSSRASSRVSATSGGGDGRVEVRGSPIPYRVGPLEYEPPVFCKCEVPRKAARWISWSLNNPGRRYYVCVDRNQEGDCGMYEWLDPPTSSWIRQLIHDLKDTVFQLKNERSQAGVHSDREQQYHGLELINQSLHRQVRYLEGQLDVKGNQLVAMEEELVKKQQQLVTKEEEIQTLQKNLEGMEEKMKVMKKKGCNSCCVAMSVFVVAFFFFFCFMNSSSK